MAKCKPIELSWTQQYRVHPAAELFPAMSPDQLDALGEDLLTNGLNEPLVFWLDNTAEKAAGGVLTSREALPHYLLDGRNRLAALERKGRTLSLVPLGKTSSKTITLRAWERDDFDSVPRLWRRGTDPWVYVLSANLHRRHLTTKQKRVVIAKVLEQRPQLSNNAMAKLVGVSDHTVAHVRSEGERSSQIAMISPAERVASDGKKSRAKKTKPALVVVKPKPFVGMMTYLDPLQMRLEELLEHMAHLQLTPQHLAAHFDDGFFQSRDKD